jgi:RimJ/RimL family protein N-acetyltransferase
VTDHIQTERLLIRPLRYEDAPDLHVFFADVQANRYFDEPHRDLATTQAWVNGSVGTNDPVCREYALLENGTVIGRAGVWNAPEFGFFLRRDSWGHGLMSEALDALIPHWFATMALSELIADVDPRNAACLILLARLGFKETHREQNTIEIGGEWCDSVYLHLPCPA